MDLSEIKELASGPKISAADLNSRMIELKSNGARILECIRYVMLNQGCSLGAAQDIVINSTAWIDQKNEFLKHQEDMFQEFLEDNNHRIEFIQMTITADDTKVVAHMKRD